MIYLHEIKNKAVRRTFLFLAFPALLLGAILYALKEWADFMTFVWHYEEEE